MVEVDWLQICAITAIKIVAFFMSFYSRLQREINVNKE